MYSLFCKTSSLLYWFFSWAILYCFSQVIYLFFPIRNSFSFNKNFFDSNFLKDFFKTQYEVLIPISEVITGSMAARLGRGIVSHLDYAHKCLQFIFSFISDSLLSVIIPVLSKSRDSIENIKNIFMITHIIAIPIAITLGFYGGEISLVILKVLGKKSISNFVSFTRVISILSFSSYFYIMNKTIGSILIAREKLNKTLIAQGMNAILNILFSIILFSYRQYGIAWASNLASLIQFLISLYNLFSSISFLSLENKLHFFLAPIIGIGLVKKEHSFLLLLCFITSHHNEKNCDNKKVVLLVFLFILLLILPKQISFIVSIMIYILGFSSYLKFLLG